jgi:hypothetical protein
MCLINSARNLVFMTFLIRYRGYSVTEDIQLDLEKTFPDYPTFGSPASEYLMVVSDIGTVLFGDLSVSRLEEMAVVAHICDRNACFAAQLCSESLNLLSCSDSACFYFIDGMQIEGAGSGMSKTKSEKEPQYGDSKHLYLGGIAPRSKSQYFKEVDSNIGDINRTMLVFDENIESLIKAVKKNYDDDASLRDASPLLLMIPSLIDALSLGISTSLRRQNIPFNSQHNMRLKSPASGFGIFMDIIFTICGSPTSPSRDSKFWAAMTAFGQFMAVTKSMEFVGSDESDDLSHQSNLEILEMSSDVLYVLSRIIHGLCDMKVKLLRTCKSTQTTVLLSQIRSIDFTSPVVIPNSSTEQGNYNLGFWIKIPVGYCDSRRKTGNGTGNGETNECIKTHILSRVPEAGEVDMNSLFKVPPQTHYD